MLHPFSFRKHSGTALALIVIAGSSAMAETISTTAFKNACETNPANTIFVNQPIKVAGGPAVTVNTSCRLVFSPGGKFETDTVSITLRGLLAFNGVTATEVSFKKTLISARSVNFDLGDPETILVVDESFVRANAGSIVISSGDRSKVTVVKNASGQAASLVATGSLIISGTEKVDWAVSETRLHGTTGISASFTNSEMTFQVQDSTLAAPSGAISITSPGEKAKFIFAIGNLTARNAITVALTGAESQVKLQGVRTASAAGSVFLESGADGNPFGLVTVVESQVTSNGVVTMRASLDAEKGESKVERNRITAPGAVLMATGENGTTTVKLNTINSGTLVRAATGPGGYCVAEGNNITSPVRQLCP